MFPSHHTVPIDHPTNNQSSNTKSITKLRHNYNTLRTLQKPNLRKKPHKQRGANKFRSFLRKLTEHKKALLKSFIPQPLFGAIASCQYIDLNLFKSLEVQFRENQCQQVQMAMKFHEDEIRSLGRVGRELCLKIQKMENDYPSTQQTIEAGKTQSLPPFRFNIEEESDMPLEDKEHSYFNCHPQDTFDKL